MRIVARYAGGRGSGELVNAPANWQARGDEIDPLRLLGVIHGDAIVASLSPASCFLVRHRKHRTSDGNDAGILHRSRGLCVSLPGHGLSWFTTVREGHDAPSALQGNEGAWHVRGRGISRPRSGPTSWVVASRLIPVAVRHPRRQPPMRHSPSRRQPASRSRPS